MPIVNVNVDDLPDSDAIPGARYKLRIDEVSDVKQDTNNDDFVSLTYTVTEGDYVNRKVYESYVPLQGRSTLKRILLATQFDKATLADTNDLIGLEFEAVVGVKKDENFGERNKISQYIIPPAVVSGAKKGKK